MVAIGCMLLQRKLQLIEWGGLSEKAALWVATMIPVGVFVGLCLLIFWVINKPSVADFMIAAESEIKKVSWSSRKEIAVSTVIVIVVVALMAVFLFVTDLNFQMFFDWILG